MFKKLTASLLAAAMMTGVGAVMPAAYVGAYEEGQQPIGDLNGDRIVNAYDLILLDSAIDRIEEFKESYDGYKFYYYTTEELGDYLDLGNIEYGDINADGRLDNMDYGYLRDYLLNKPTPFNQVIGSTRLSRGSYLPERMGKEVTKEFADAHMKFGVDLFKKSYAEKSENAMISPLSVEMALSMAANGASGETLSQMEKALGGDLTMDQIDSYLAYHKNKLESAEESQVAIADSIWFRESSPYKIKDTFLDKNMEYLGAEAYASAFDDSTVDDINSWIFKNTQGVIKSLLDKDQNPLGNAEMCLVNTVYFDSLWSHIYLDSSPMDFTTLSGKKVKPEGLYSSEGMYLESENYTGFKKWYAGGDYSFVGILPNEGIDFNEFIAGLDAEELLSTISSPKVNGKDGEYFDLYVTMPAFKSEYMLDEKKVLKSMGITDAFDQTVADFSEMADIPEGADPLYISSVLHKTVIDVNKSGTTAAAVTAVLIAGAAAPQKVYKVVMDRPYVYMIVDNSTNLPLFIGAVTEL